MKMKNEVSIREPLLPSWEPFRELENLQDRMRSLFLKTGNGEGALAMEPEFSDWSPAVDISEDDDEFTISADLPEVKKKDLHVTLDDGQLTIRGEREHKEEEKKKKFHRIERSYGKYVRSFRLPEEVNPDKIDARFDEGVLTIHLPKDKNAKHAGKHIAIH